MKSSGPGSLPEAVWVGGAESTKSTEMVVPETVAPESIGSVEKKALGKALGSDNLLAWHLRRGKGKYQRGSGRGAEQRRRQAHR